MKHPPPFLLILLILIIFVVGYLFGTTAGAGEPAAPRQAEPQPAEQSSSDLGRWMMIVLLSALGFGAVVSFCFTQR